MMFEGFEINGGEESVLLPADHPQKRALVRNGVCIYRVEAETWEDAMKAWHKFKGWEDYVPSDNEV